MFILYLIVIKFKFSFETLLEIAEYLLKQNQCTIVFIFYLFECLIFIENDIDFYAIEKLNQIFLKLIDKDFSFRVGS